MRRRVEMQQSQYLASTVSSRRAENATRDWCKMDELSRDKKFLATEKLRREQEEERGKEKEQQERARRVQEEQEQERAKADKLIEQRRRATCDKKLRQKLREECEELRILEQQLRTAYVAKENSFQIGEKRTRQLQQKIDEEKERRAVEEKRLAAIKDEEQKAVQMHLEKVQLRKCLQEQMTETFNRKRVRYEDFLREKEWIDDITNRLQEEQVQEVEKKMRRIQEESQAIDQYREERERYRIRQQQLNEEENQRISHFLREKQLKEQHEEARKKAQLQQKTALVEKLTQHLSEMETEARQREELMVELNMKELAEREEVRWRKKLEEQLRRRVQTRLELEKQREFLWMRQQQEKEEDRLFKEEQLRMLADSDRLELMSNEMKRRKQVEHRKSVEELLERRRQQRIQEMAEAKSRHEAECEEGKRIREVIEEERIKILQEHAQELIGFLPAGVLRQSDAQQLPLPTRNNVMASK